MLKRVRVIAQIVFGVAALALLIWAIASRWADVAAALTSMQPGWVVAAAVLILAGLYVNMLSWRAIVAALGVRLSPRQAASVFFTSQLGKYIPGGVWPIVASARIGRAFGLTALHSVGSMTIALLLSVMVGSVVAVGALFAAPGIEGPTMAVPIVLLVVGLVLLFPPILNRLIMLGLRILRRDGGLPRLATRPFAAAAGWSVLSWMLLGGAVSALVAASGADAVSTVLIAISAYALSWVVGFAALVVPAGVGVREGVLVLVLGAFLTVPAVLGVAVVHRVFMTIGDAAMLAFTAPLRRRVLEQPVTAGEEEST
jgi:uncharacterized membrane protein YbhN (UPF0104 family)